MRFFFTLATFLHPSEEMGLGLREMKKKRIDIKNRVEFSDANGFSCYFLPFDSFICVLCSVFTIFARLRSLFIRFLYYEIYIKKNLDLN